MTDWGTDDFTPLLTRLDALNVPGEFMTARTKDQPDRRVFGVQLRSGGLVVEWPENTLIPVADEAKLTAALLKLTAEQGRRVLTWQVGENICVRIMKPGQDGARSQEVTHPQLLMALLRAVVEHFEQG